MLNLIKTIFKNSNFQNKKIIDASSLNLFIFLSFILIISSLLLKIFTSTFNNLNSVNFFLIFYLISFNLLLNFDYNVFMIIDLITNTNLLNSLMLDLYKFDLIFNLYKLNNDSIVIIFEIITKLENTLMYFYFLIGYIFYFFIIRPNIIFIKNTDLSNIKILTSFIYLNLVYLFLLILTPLLLLFLIITLFFLKKDFYKNMISVKDSCSNILNKFEGVSFINLQNTKINHNYLNTIYVYIIMLINFFKNNFIFLIYLISQSFNIYINYFFQYFYNFSVFFKKFFIYLSTLFLFWRPLIKRWSYIGLFFKTKTNLLHSCNFNEIED